LFVVASPLNFHLEQYDGPLDLLLDLIRKQEINIYDIPIARITEQYLEYMQRAAEMNIELSAEFIYMAATLIHIKSRMLLPRIRSWKSCCRRKIRARNWWSGCWSASASRPRPRCCNRSAWWKKRSGPTRLSSSFRAEAGEPELAVTLFDLAKTFQAVLDRSKNRPVYEIDQEEVSVPDMLRYLHKVFGRESEIAAAELFERQRSRRAMICLFWLCWSW